MLTKRQIFDWAVGDETHIISGDPYHPASHIDRIIITQKWFSNDQQTVYYKHDNNGFYTTADYSTNIPIITYHFFFLTDTLVFDQLDSNIYSFIKKDFEFLNDSLVFYNQSIDTSFNNLKRFQYYTSPFYLPMFWYGDIIEKVGVFYKSFDDPSSIPVINEETRIFYFKRGSYTWGTPNQTTQSIKVANDKIDLEVYPNPANVSLNIKLPDYEFYHIDIIDFSGKIIFSEQNVNTSIIIKIDQIPKGIYLLSARSNNRSISRKISIY